VRLGLRLAEALEEPRRPLLDGRRQVALPDQPQDLRKVPAVPMVMMLMPVVMVPMVMSVLVSVLMSVFLSVFMLPLSLLRVGPLHRTPIHENPEAGSGEATAHRLAALDRHSGKVETGDRLGE